MVVVLQVLFNGLATGAIYSLIALGFVAFRFVAKHVPMFVDLTATRLAGPAGSSANGV